MAKQSEGGNIQQFIDDMDTLIQDGEKMYELSRRNQQGCKGVCRQCRVSIQGAYSALLLCMHF